MGLDVFDNYECDGQLSLFEKPKDDSAKTNSFTPAKVHCLFEQSGTFKNEFINLGIPAEDYDIQDDFGQTDHMIDLFEQINNAYDGKPSIFDNVKNDEIVMAFFPWESINLLLKSIVNLAVEVVGIMVLMHGSFANKQAKQKN